MTEIFIIDAKRTIVGSFGGSLAGLPAHLLGKNVITALLKNNPQIEASQISEVILGQVLTAGMGQNPARQAAIAAGIPQMVPAFNVGKVCGSGLKAVALAATAIKAGEADIVIAGGQENMSMSPHFLNLRNPTKMGEAKMQDSMIIDGLTDAFSLVHMGITAENIAEKFSITKKEQDEFACHSQNKAEKAKKEGRFKDEIVPVEVISKKETKIIEIDEFIRDGVTIDDLSKLKPAFQKDGTVTAGNASGLNDGAAALILASADAVKRLGLKPMARIASFASSGVDPQIMGTGPISAVKMALTKAGISKNDLGLIEANEAFAAQAIAVNRGLEWDLSKVNVNGGAIAIGHPIGASGARILVTLLHEMKKRNEKWGAATLCIGGGMGIAMVVEM